MTVTADALDMLAGDPVRERKPGDFHRHPTTGAPYVIVEKDGKRRKVMYGRPSSFGSALDNPFNLLKWKERQLVAGIARQPDAGGVDLLNLDDRDEVDTFIAYAYDVAETSLAADRGTHIHLLLEHADKSGFIASLFDDGERLGIPRGLQLKIVKQWIAFRQRLGITALAVEQTVVNDRWRLAGTLDRLDVTSTPILTAYGILDGAFVGDIKTGGLTVGTDGQPNFWVKYPIQLAAYVDGVPYDTDTDERGEWICDGLVGEPNPDIALIYHYDLARALAGEVVDWVAIPVNVQAGREGGDLCRAAADFGKRRDLFAMPAPTPVASECVHEWDLTTIYTSNPPQRKCVKCGAFSGMTFHQNAAPASVPAGVVEQCAVDPQPETASSPVAVSAAAPDLLRARIGQLVAAGHEQLMRQAWPDGVKTLKHHDHDAYDLERILAAVRRVEAEVGAGWHPDDSPDPHSTKAIRRALDAWAGRDPGTAWFAASLIATFEQCRNADATFKDLVSQFSIEQADRLYDAAQAAQ